LYISVEPVGLSMSVSPSDLVIRGYSYSFLCSSRSAIPPSVYSYSEFQ